MGPAAWRPWLRSLSPNAGPDVGSRLCRVPRPSLRIQTPRRRLLVCVCACVCVCARARAGTVASWRCAAAMRAASWNQLVVSVSFYGPQRLCARCHAPLRCCERRAAAVARSPAPVTRGRGAGHVAAAGVGEPGARLRVRPGERRSGSRSESEYRVGVLECGQVSGCPVHGPSQSTELASWSAAR